ncbi:MAG: hypothetical protein B7X07_05175, partial [Actinobacteria bacterium 21-64-8]
MRTRRSSLRLLALGAVALMTVVVPLNFSSAAPVTSANENGRTIVLALPGPFTGCTYLNGAGETSTGAILDLVRPSAFVTTPEGDLQGQGGAITSAELTSLQPETVRYTLARGLHWSNGALFTGSDLVAWWQRARRLSSVVSDGYRAISSLSVSNAGRTVLAVFHENYADWNLLFRDVEERGVAGGCALSKLLRDPSLGPYRVVSATTSRVVLAMNPSWPLDPNRFGHVVVTTTRLPPSGANVEFAGYSSTVTQPFVQALSSYPALSSRIGISNEIAEVTYAPGGAATRRLVVRKALSWALNRQAMIDRLWGSVTFSPSVADSALYSQGQSAYPGFGGSGPAGQATTTTTTPSAATNGLGDCFICAVQLLRSSGYQHRLGHWYNTRGTPLAIRLGVGPSDLDAAIARLALASWNHLGIIVRPVHESSDVATSVAVATSTVDVGIFSRPTSTAVSTTARSWSGASFRDSYPSGVRMSKVVSLFTQGVTTFNPVTANSTWLQMDQILMRAYWVRPLFTTPTVESWSSTLSSVQGSFLVAGYVDQLPSWSVSPLQPS